jgi:HEAT repeat protein
LLTDPRLRSALCGRCLTDASLDRGVWAVALKDESPRPEQLDAILKDDDWQVRWGALRAMAAIKGFSEARELATWIVDAHDSQPCLTAVHLAASRSQSTATLLQSGGTMGPSAAALCWQKKEELRKELEVQLYSPDSVTRREALTHLAAFLEMSPARVVLNAMATRMPTTDDAAARLLVEDAESGGPAAGAAVLTSATKTDAARVDRLLAVWSRTLDAQRPKLKATVPQDRQEAIAALSVIGPLGAVELESLLEDPDPAVRLAAGRALARGEGKSLESCAREKLDPSTRVPNPVRQRWAEFLGHSPDDNCEGILKEAAAQTRLDDSVRAVALTALGHCAGAKALPQVKQALGSKSPRYRIAALDALAEMPRVPEAAQSVDNALKEVEPDVLAAAVRAAAAQRLTARVPLVMGLLDHGVLEVRLAAAKALVTMGDARAAAALGRALLKDASVEVREACAKGLGELGGPEAPGPLTHASEKDASSRVKYVAGESLRKLGFTRVAK